MCIFILAFRIPCFFVFVFFCFYILKSKNVGCHFGVGGDLQKNQRDLLLKRFHKKVANTKPLDRFLDNQIVICFFSFFFLLRKCFNKEGGKRDSYNTPLPPSQVPYLVASILHRDIRCPTKNKTFFSFNR